ncbi:MAG: DinB family protein [Tistlia sp.]|uniref:DinB family protein n=1 Tax=Tistlia sp. TaxID=3057121 RepID=UPI0034A21462
MIPEQARIFAGYNSWANERLYEAVAALPESDYRRDLQAFFGSLHGTLSHILVGDLLWLGRIGRDTLDVAPPPAGLDAVPFEDLAGLRAARRRADGHIAEFCADLTPKRLAGTVTYLRWGEPSSQRLWQILAHLFNHQTHHRGQAHGLLTRLGREAPPLDLIYYLRETG